jgi:hypothetical protein
MWELALRQSAALHQSDREKATVHGDVAPYEQRPHRSECHERLKSEIRTKSAKCRKSENLCAYTGSRLDEFWAAAARRPDLGPR